MHIKRLVLLAPLFALVAACSSGKNSSTALPDQSLGLRDYSADEKMADFIALKSLFATYYGPYQYKEKRLGMNIDKVITDLAVQAQKSKTDEEFTGYIMQVQAALKDVHVQLQVENTASGISLYRIPIVITPIENRAIIAGITDDLKNFTGFNVGDEVLEVDGKAPMAYLPIITKYKSMAVDVATPHLIYQVFSRPSYVTELVPTSPFASVKVKTVKGQVRSLYIPWETAKYNQEMDKLVPPRLQLRVSIGDEIDRVVNGSIRQMGQVNPIFITPQTETLYKFARVYPSLAARKKFGLDEKETPPIYAALYNYKGKNILLVRQATYSPRDYKSPKYLAAYQALFSEFQNVADVMVLDQTHNPGGSYCSEFYNLFARETDMQGVEYLHADRKWINDLRLKWQEPNKDDGISYDNRSLDAWSMLVEKAYDAKQNLSEAVPLFSSSNFAQPARMVWSKPMLVLIDELAGSCGDMFPMLVKANNRAKLFGQTTMGAGGNVEEVGILPNSRIHISMTRGMFFPFNPSRGPTDAEIVENNGVTPDIPYTHTVSDFRNGFVGYVKAFSDKAVEQIP